MGSLSSFPQFSFPHTSFARFPRQRTVVSVVAVALLLGGAGVGALVYHNGHLPLAHPLSPFPVAKDGVGGSASAPSLMQAQSAALTTTPTAPAPTASTHAGWTTEQGSSLSLKRPQTWFGAASLGLSNQGDALTFASEHGEYPFDLSAKGIYVATGVLPVSGAEIYNEVFASPLGRVTLHGSVDPSNIYTKLASLTLAGLPAVEYSVDYSDNPQGQLNEDLVYVVEKGDQYYSVTFSLNKAYASGDQALIETIIHSLTFSN